MPLDDARWFQALGKCASCSQPAQGTVFGSRNERMNVYCIKHGEQRVKRAKEAREKKEHKSV